MAEIDTLVKDIYGLFKHKELLHPELFAEFGGNMEQLMVDRFKERKQGGYLRMSNIGRPDRQLWLEVNENDGEKEALPPATMVKFAYGDLIEQLILLYAKMAGHEVRDEQKEVEVGGVKGHIDAIIDGVMVDVKSASTFSFKKFESGDLFLPGNDPFGYVAQLAGYIEATNPGGRGGFLAVDKTLGKICFCEIPRDVLDRYDVKKRIETIKEVVVSPDIPDKCYSDVPDGKSGNMKLDTGCSYCQRKHRCWPGLKTYFYAGGPRYLTKVVREPKVQAEFPPNDRQA